MMDRHGTECCCSAQRTRTWLFFFALLRTRRRNHIFQLSPLCGHFQSKYRSRDAFYWFAVTRLIFRQEIERINGTNIERVAGTCVYFNKPYIYFKKWNRCKFRTFGPGEVEKQV